MVPDNCDTLNENRVVSALSRVSGFMSEVTDLNGLLTLIVRESEALMRSEASACMLYDSASDELYFEVALGAAAEGVKKIRLKRGTGIAWDCLERNQTLVVNDPYQYGAFYANADKLSSFTTRNMVATPMIFRGELIGALEVLNKHDGAAYDDNDAKIMSIIADQAAMAIANARLIERSIQRERLAAIGVAVSGVAHHLKNIILSVKGPIGLIRMGLKMGKMDLIEQSVPIMERGSARMEQSVKEMLDYSKDREPDLELGNLGELLREIVDGCKTRAANAGIDLQLRVEENLADSMLDKFRLHDAILNIVGNAIEAQPAGAENPWIRVSAWTAKSGDRHLIEIRDNGPGIPPDVLARIFQPFFSTKGSKGTGLGLAVAQKVAEENGGSLSVENEFGKGAVFTFQLAVRPPRVESPSKSNQEAPLS